MNLERQKYQEGIIIEQFRNAYGDFPKGKLQVFESPDFILKLKPRKWIGIELTSVGNVDQADLSLSDQIHEIIGKKDDKLAEYQNPKIYLFWLIVTVDYLSDRDIKVINELPVKSRYEKVFLFDLFENAIFELK